MANGVLRKAYPVYVRWQGDEAVEAVRDPLGRWWFRHRVALDPVTRDILRRKGGPCVFHTWTSWVRSDQTPGANFKIAKRRKYAMLPLGEDDAYLREDARRDVQGNTAEGLG